MKLNLVFWKEQLNIILGYIFEQFRSELVSEGLEKYRLGILYILPWMWLLEMWYIFNTSDE